MGSDLFLSKKIKAHFDRKNQLFLRFFKKTAGFLETSGLYLFDLQTQPSVPIRPVPLYKREIFTPHFGLLALIEETCRRICKGRQQYNDGQGPAV